MADATPHPAIRAVDIRKSFGRTAAVDRASVEVGHGEIVALLGPSGSGKTTLLRVVAGFEVPDAGTVEIGGRRVAGPGVWEEPDRRRVGMVFQDGALFPHLTVARNVAFGEPAPGRVEECLALVGLVAIRHGAGTTLAYRAIGLPGVLVGLSWGFGLVLFVYAVNHTAVANVLVILSTMPLFAALFTRLLIGEAIQRISEETSVSSLFD